MKKWVFFDVMGVVFEVGDDTNDLLVPFIRNIRPEISSKAINDLYLKASLGAISSYEFWTSLGFPSKCFPEIGQDYLENSLKLDQNIISVFQILSRDFNLGLISNDVSEWSSYLRKRYDLDKYLNCIIISGDVNCRKPNKSIYTMALEKVGCEANKCVFVDDRLKNLHPAFELGMHVIKFNREDAYSEDLIYPQANCLLEIPRLVYSVFSEEKNYGL